MKKKLLLGLLLSSLVLSFGTGCGSKGEDANQNLAESDGTTEDIFNSDEEGKTGSSGDKGILENETFSFVDKHTREEYKGIEVVKSYGFVNSLGRNQRCFFLKNTTDSNLYLYVTSQMLDESGNSAEEQRHRIDVLGPDEIYIVTEDYYNEFNDFSTLVEVSEPAWTPCSEDIAIVEETCSEKEITVTFKNSGNTKIIGGKIQLLAYKDGQIVDWSHISIGSLEPGESDTDDAYLGEFDHYELYIYAHR